jgi:putative transcriptional regulator
MTKLHRVVALAIAGLASILAVGGIFAASKTDGGAMVLVATPRLEPPFGETVLLVLPVGKTQHVGFILNRPLEQNLGNLLPEVGPAKKVVDPVLFGGPVMTDIVFAIAPSPKDKDAEDKSVPAFDNLVVSASAQVISGILENNPNTARYLVGFVGWEPGELAEEIKKGFWYVTKPSSELVLHAKADGMWKNLVASIEKQK